MKGHLAVSAVAVVAGMLAAVEPVRADGYEFFTVDRGREVNLVYVGQIREKDSGRVVRAPAYFMVTEKRSGMTFPFVNDRPGHYRSPDIGESVEELAGTPVNPADLEFEVVIEGYKKVTTASVPRKNKGVVEVNIRVERDESNAAVNAAGSGTADARPAVSLQSAGMSSGTPPAGAPPGGPGSRTIRFILMGLAATIIAGAAARTLVPRQSTSR